jgi:hypothetical protein
MTPNLTCSSKITDKIKLRVRKARKKSIHSLRVCIVLSNLKRSGMNCQHNVGGTRTNVPYVGSKALKIGTHAHLPIGIVITFEPRDFARGAHGCYNGALNWLRYGALLTRL